MDLSPSSKRIKSGFSPPSSQQQQQPATIGTMGHAANSAGSSNRKISQGLHHLPEFDHAGLFLPSSGHHPSAASVSSSSAAAAAAVLVGKSLPIHCVIEVIDKEAENCLGRGSGPSSSGGDNNNGARGGDKTASGKSETCGSGIGNPANSGGAGSLHAGGVKIVEVDDFVIIPVGTPFQDVVITVLTLLGYPKDVIQQAEGSILLKNWKPLRLDQVCDSPHKTVGDILNDLTNHVTLQVLVTRPKGGPAEDLKEKLLRLLLAQSSNILMGSGCPLDEATLGQLVKGQWPQNLAEDVKRRFDQWYSVHQQKLAMGSEQTHPALSHSHHSTSNSHQILSGSNGNNRGSPTNLSVNSSSSHQHSHLVNGSSIVSSVRHHLLDKTAYEEDNHAGHPVFHGLTTQKTRMRTSFDPEMEIPRLQHWFSENPHPSRHQIQQYVRELNTLDCRKDRKPLDLNNVIYWFKNSRASFKRNELRYNGYSPNQSFSHLHSQNSGSNPRRHGEDNKGDVQLHSGDRDERDFSNENSGSNCRDSCDDHDQDMKEYHRVEMDGDNDESEERADNQRESISKRNEECGGVGENEEEEDEIKVVIKEEIQDEDFISVDVELSEGTGGNLNLTPHQSPGSGGGGGGSGEEEGGESCNNNEQPKDLSSGKPQQNQEKNVPLKKNEEHDKKESSTPIVSKSRHLRQQQMEQQHQQQEHEGESNSSSPSVSPAPSSPGMSPNHPYDFSAPSMVSRFHPFFDHHFMAYRHFNSFNFGQNFPGSNGPEGHHSPSGYESAMGLVGRKISPGKPSPGMEAAFHDFQNGVPMVQSRGASGGGGSMVGGSTAGDHMSRIRGEDLFAARSASSAELISSIINSNRGDLGLSPLNLGSHHQNPNSLALDERRKRNRTFIDPVTEVPRLEQWFALNTHPSHNLILKYTEELNRMPYRQKFPKLEPKNVQFWMKNRRAKCKRLKMTL
ncbi:uncharacterized protein LOC110847017 isoform X3 [Folsomia candida]|nr:uncharacterized protein LOC110847017 isoform X3 [Folsomia candida]XP_035705704.1 uncharacterized protein LOC110847017 isoform X3 [Folsomia candida]